MVITFVRIVGTIRLDRKKTMKLSNKITEPTIQSKHRVKSAAKIQTRLQNAFKYGSLYGPAKALADKVSSTQKKSINKRVVTELKKGTKPNRISSGRIK